MIQNHSFTEMLQGSDPEGHSQRHQAAACEQQNLHPSACIRQQQDHTKKQSSGSQMQNDPFQRSRAVQKSPCQQQEYAALYKLKQKQAVYIYDVSHLSPPVCNRTAYMG